MLKKENRKVERIGKTIFEYYDILFFKYIPKSAKSKCVSNLFFYKPVRIVHLLD